LRARPVTTRTATSTAAATTPSVFGLLDLAEVLRRTGRPGDAAQAVQEAARLFQRKGNRPAAEQAAATLRDLEG
jgi:hypothetical protein